MMPPLGQLNQMWATPGTSDREAVDNALAEISLADELGFTSVWVGEHHTARLQLDQLDVMAQIPALPTDAIRRSLKLIQNEVRPLLRIGRG